QRRPCVPRVESVERPDVHERCRRFDDCRWRTVLEQQRRCRWTEMRQRNESPAPVDEDASRKHAARHRQRELSAYAMDGAQPAALEEATGTAVGLTSDGTAVRRAHE